MTKNIDFPKLLFFITCIIIVIVCIFIYGVIVGTYQVFPYAILDHIKDSVVQVYEERRTLIKTHPEHFLKPARYDGNGVTVNKVPENQKDLILLSSFFENTNELRLIRRDGAIIARWPVTFSEIFPDTSHIQDRSPPATDWNIDVHGALAMPDGSVVFNFEYGGLVRMDRCGDVIWALPYQTHHSVERAENGGYWVPGRRNIQEMDTQFPPFMTPYREDTLLKISDTGDVLAEISVPGLFYENGLEALLTSSGEKFQSQMNWDNEIVHLNKIEELTTDIAGDFPDFEAGDLALSLGNYNLILVVDPDTLKIKWWRIGPWLRQHDPEFKPGGKIVIFNNNIYRTASGSEASTSLPSIPRVSTIVEIDPASGEYQIIYGGKKSQELLSVLRGKVELLPNDGLLITEFDGGRVFETDASGNIIWEYVNRYSRDEVAEITEARVYPVSYFRVSSCSCEDRRE